MKKRIELLDDSLDWVKSRKLAVLVSITPMLSVILEPLIAILVDSLSTTPSPWGNHELILKHSLSFVLGLLPRIALAHLLWQTLQLTTEERPLNEVAKTFRRRGWLRWLLWGTVTVLLFVPLEFFFNENAKSSSEGLLLFAAFFLIEILFGFFVVLFHQRLLVRVLTVRQTPSYDARACLLFALVAWLSYMEVYLFIGVLFTDRILPFPIVLWLFAVAFCVTLVISEVARIMQLKSLQKDQLEGYQLRAKQEVTIPPDITLFPLLAGTPTESLNGVVLKKIVAPDGQPFRDESESLLPIAYSAMPLSSSIALVTKRLLRIVIALALHLYVLYIAFYH